jgi:hypothetical protein
MLWIHRVNKTFKYNPETDPYAEYVEKALDTDETVPVKNKKNGEYLRQRFSKTFASVAADYKRLMMPFIRPKPHLVKTDEGWMVIIDRKDGRR